METLGIVLGIGIPLLAILIIIYAVQYTKVGPNEVLVISGRRRSTVDKEGRRIVKGYRLVKGGGVFVWPIKEQVRRFSLELMSLEIRTPEVYTAPGVPVIVDGVAQVKVKSEEDSIDTAVEQFLSKAYADIVKTALQVVEGHMRAVIGTVTIEEIYGNRAAFAAGVKEAAGADLAKMGLEIISLTIRNISDSHGYLEAIGKPRVAQVKRDAIIGEARADEEGKKARFLADTKIEEARKEHDIKKAEYAAEVSKKRAEADLAYDLQRYKSAQHVKREEIQVGIIEKECLTELQDKEILRREKELQASVVKPADADRAKIRALSEAERFRLEAEAEGRAASIRATGLAEAEVIRQKGFSEAEAMLKKAESWSRYNEAAIAEMVIQVLPKLTQAVSEPLSKVERIVMISNDAGGGGAGKLAKDITEVIAQLPPLVESLTGVKLDDLLRRIPGVGAGSRAEKEEAKTAKE